MSGSPKHQLLRTRPRPSKHQDEQTPDLGQYSDNLDSVDENGCVYAPTGNGIGVPLNWDWINAHKTGTRVIAEV